MEGGYRYDDKWEGGVGKGYKGWSLVLFLKEEGGNEMCFFRL